MRKSKLTLMVLAIAVTLGLTNCGGNLEVGTPITAEQFKKLRENAENSGKRFSITGYPYLSKSDVTVRNDMKISVPLHSEPQGKGELIGSIRLDYKELKNGMYIPNQFTPDDLVIYDNEGNELGVNDKITISFTLKLDTKREPGKSNIIEKDERGMPKSIPIKSYYGDGPVDIRIDKAQ
jgi:hypothetical protein